MWTNERWRRVAVALLELRPGMDPRKAEEAIDHGQAMQSGLLKLDIRFPWRCAAPVGSEQP
eukprot:2562-Alexandrium_andersonii.AAC.1